MPWGAWVTCEETVNGPDVGADFTGASNVPLTRPHGYVFEVPVSHQPGRGQSNRQADHARRAVRPRGRLVRPARRPPLPHRGQLRVPVRLLPLPPAAAPDEGRPTARRRLAADAQGQGHRQRPPRGRAGHRHDVRRRVGRHPRARHRLRLHARASRRRLPTTRPSSTSAPRAQARVRPGFSRLEGQAYDAGWCTSPRPRAAARPRPGPDSVDRLRQRLRPGVGLRHRAAS